MSFEIIIEFSEVAYCMMLLTISCLCFITVVFVFSVIFYHRWSSSPLHANQQNTCSLATPQFSRPRDTSIPLRHYSLADTSLRQNSTFSVHLPEFWEFNVTGSDGLTKRGARCKKSEGGPPFSVPKEGS